MNDPFQHIQLALGQLASIIVAIALAVLWLKRRSGWALLALIGELGSMTCSLVFILNPQLLSRASFLLLLWPLNALIFASGLLGYACLDARRVEPAPDAAPDAAPATGTAP